MKYLNIAYEKLPLYRRWWFLIIALIAFFPSVIIIMLTGGVYTNNHGLAKPLKKTFKIIIWIVISAALVIQLYQWSQLLMDYFENYS